MTAHQRALDNLREYLTENVDLTYGILWDFLRQNQVVSLEERETIQDRSDSNANQVDHLINLLRIREEANTRRFIQALEQTDHREVAERLGNRIDLYKASVSGLYRATLGGSLKALLYILILFVLGQNFYFNIKELYTNYKCRPIADQFGVRYGKITLWGSSEPWTVPTSSIMTPCAIVQNNRSLTGLTTTAVYCFYDVLKYKPPYYIRVTGEVGRGKTTLSRQVALYWAEYTLEGPHFQFPVLSVMPIDLVLPVELKHVTENDTLESLLRREFRFVGQNALDYLLSVVTNSPDRVLFLFDGLDEMSKNASKDILSILKREDNTLRLNMVITTREHAAHLVGPSMGKNDIELQLTGFEWQHISQYVSRFFSDKDPRMGQDLLRHLWVNLELQSMAKSPMLLQLLCTLRLKGKSEINHRTSVYTEYLYIELNRFRHEKHPDLRRLSRHELLLEYKEILMKLGALYFADCEGKQFQSVFDLWCIEDKVGKEVFSLGLLDTSVPSAPYDAKHVGFIHRSFQEYLAALVIFLGDNISEEVLVKHCVTPQLLNEKKTILQCLAGLSSDTSNRVMQKIQVSLSNFGENLNLYQSSEMLYAYRESLVWYSQWRIVYEVFLSVLLEHRDLTQVNFSFVSLHLKTNLPEINIIYNYTKANPSILRNLHAIIVDGSDYSTITRIKNATKHKI